ncbi:hypothetical protein F4780DRAFT_750625 [Xylariomycetidae sp. FL0641]|nr:hypothetical protein F4780DRAFT_750625 [Xylariomycetidae sp. FL0641]
MRRSSNGNKVLRVAILPIRDLAGDRTTTKERLGAAITPYQAAPLEIVRSAYTKVTDHKPAIADFVGEQPSLVKEGISAQSKSWMPRWIGIGSTDCPLQARSRYQVSWPVGAQLPYIECRFGGVDRTEQYHANLNKAQLTEQAGTTITPLHVGGQSRATESETSEQRTPGWVLKAGDSMPDLHGPSATAFRPSRLSGTDGNAQMEHQHGQRKIHTPHNQCPGCLVKQSPLLIGDASNTGRSVQDLTTSSISQPSGIRLDHFLLAEDMPRLECSVIRRTERESDQIDLSEVVSEALAQHSDDPCFRPGMR